MKDRKTPPFSWKIIHTTAVHPFPVNVRMVAVRHKDGEFQRPVVKLVP